jgi:hypothetical protein
MGVVKNQFPSKEERIGSAVDDFKKFLREGAPDGVSLEVEYTERYLALLGACEFDEGRAIEIIEDCVEAVGTNGEA